jgi:hypothetical protein
MDEITILLAVCPGLIALIWSMYQQYALNKICEKCPFRLKSEQIKPLESPVSTKNPTSN